MKLKILLMLIVASAICIVKSEPSKKSVGGSGNPFGIIKAELIEEDAPSAVGGNVAVGDQVESESAQRIVIKPVRRHRGKRIRIRLVNGKPKNYVRLKVSGTKNVEQKYPGEDEENGGTGTGTDYDSLSSNVDEEGNETNSPEPYQDGSEDDTTASDDTQNGEEAMKVKHHHHHHHHNHIKTVVKKEPYPVEKIVPVEKIIEKVVYVPKPYPVEKVIEVPKPYPVERIVHVPKIVEKLVYSPLFGKDNKHPASTTTLSGSHSHGHFTDLTHDSKLKFGASGSSLDIIYPNGHTSSYANNHGKPLGKHPKFPDFEDINKQSNKVHSILDNDAFDFGDMHTSKPKDHHNEKKNHKKNKRRNNKNKKPIKGLFDHHDDYFPSSSAPNSHSYSGITMPSYTHEFSVSNSDQKEVFYNPGGKAHSSSASSSPSHHHHQVHYESLPFKYPGAAVVEPDNEYVGHASTQNADFSQYNWSPSVEDFGSSSSAFNLPTQYSQGGGYGSLAAAESAQIGPVFRPPRKNPPVPFHGKKGSHGAPRAGPRRPPRNNQGESYHRGHSPPKMAGHPQHHRPEGMARAASNKAYVHQSRPRPVMAAASEQFETVMAPPVARV